MRAVEMKKKLIAIIHDNNTYGGNPYACDQEAEQKFEGQVKVCEDLMEMLGMKWAEVEAAYKKQNGL